MAEYQLSSKAAQALEDIFIYTVSKFGWAQAEAYHEGFHRIFLLLTDFPHMGQSADEYVPGMQKFRHQSHLIGFSLRTDRNPYGNPREFHDIVIS